MGTHEFTLHLDRFVGDDDYDRVVEAGLDDTYPESGGNGHPRVSVIREAPSLEEAIVDVVAGYEALGFRCTQIEDEDDVPLSSVAERLGRTYESVRLLANGKRGPGGFPAGERQGRWTFYSWTAVARWAKDKLGADVEVDHRARILSAANHMLAARNLTSPEERSQLARLVA